MASTCVVGCEPRNDPATGRLWSSRLFPGPRLRGLRDSTSSEPLSARSLQAPVSEKALATGPLWSHIHLATLISNEKKKGPRKSFKIFFLKEREQENGLPPTYCGVLCLSFYSLFALRREKIHKSFLNQNSNLRNFQNRSILCQRVPSMYPELGAPEIAWLQCRGPCQVGCKGKQLTPFLLAYHQHFAGLQC